MTFKHITSRDNPIFKYLKRLSDSARERKHEGATLLDGVHLIEAYVHVYGEPDLIIIPEGKSVAEATQLMQRLQDVNTIMLPTLMFAELSPVVTSTGILAKISIPKLALPEQPSMLLMLEDIQDPGNMGSMLRTAAAAGVELVYLSKGCTDAWSPKAMRGGQGAQLVLPMVEVEHLAIQIQQFSGKTYAMTMDGESVYEQNLTQACMFVVGNEGAGVSISTQQACSRLVTIPMAQTNHYAVESLNAAAAAAICLFECRRQQLMSSS